jgi:hypothetical protein
VDGKHVAAGRKTPLRAPFGVSALPINQSRRPDVIPTESCRRKRLPVHFFRPRFPITQVVEPTGVGLGLADFDH